MNEERKPNRINNLESQKAGLLFSQSSHPRQNPKQHELVLETQEIKAREDANS